jgi:hypothetical protein
VAASFIGGGNLINRKKTTNLSQGTDKLYDIIVYTSPSTGLEFTTLVVVGTGFTDSLTSTHNTITTSMTPKTI